MRFRSGLATVLDQALLSLLNLGISLAFIRYAPKQEYGVYLLLLTPLFLIQGLQNAVLLSPIATVLPASSEEQKLVVIKTAISSQVVFLGAAALLGACALLVYFQLTQGVRMWGLCVAFGLAVAGSSAREAARSLFYAQGRADRALLSDGVYGAGLLFSMVTLLFVEQLSAISALLVMGGAALWPYFLQAFRGFHFELDRTVLERFWACGRWALVGVVVTWINLNSYPLIVGMYLSASSVADINTARLFMMPFALGITGWSNLVRPRISAWMAQGERGKVRHLSLQSISAGLFSLSFFLLVLWFAYPYIEPVLGPNYSGLRGLAMLWGLFFSVNLVRTVLMASLMTDAAGYKSLQGVSWFALIFSLAGLVGLTPFGVEWVLAVLIGVEVMQMCVIGYKACARWKA